MSLKQNLSNIQYLADVVDAVLCSLFSVVVLWLLQQRFIEEVSK